MTQNLEIRALTFDVFGTVVDWRGSIIAEGERLNRDWELSVDWATFASAWRARYQPSMEAENARGQSLTCCTARVWMPSWSSSRSRD